MSPRGRGAADGEVASHSHEQSRCLVRFSLLLDLEAQRHSLEQSAVDACCVNEGRHVRAAEHVDDICTGPRSELDNLVQALRSETRLDVCANMCNTAASSQVAGKGLDDWYAVDTDLGILRSALACVRMEGAKQRWETSRGPCEIQCVLFE